jgi:hypothetical protein
MLQLTLGNLDACGLGEGNGGRWEDPGLSATRSRGRMAAYAHPHAQQNQWMAVSRMKIHHKSVRVAWDMEM